MIHDDAQGDTYSDAYRVMKQPASKTTMHQVANIFQQRISRVQEGVICILGRRRSLQAGIPAYSLEIALSNSCHTFASIPPEGGNESDDDELMSN